MPVAPSEVPPDELAQAPAGVAGPSREPPPAMSPAPLWLSIVIQTMGAIFVLISAGTYFAAFD